jgi:hypothetical protein
LTFHDPEADSRLSLDLSDPKAHLERREEEALAELLRPVLRRPNESETSLRGDLETDREKEGQIGPRLSPREQRSVAAGDHASKEIAVAPLPESD